MGKIKAMLKSIEDDPNAEPFLQPVAWQGIIIVKSNYLCRAWTFGLSLNSQKTYGFLHNTSKH